MDDSGCVFRLQDNSPIPQSNANGSSQYKPSSISNIPKKICFRISDPIKIEFWKGSFSSLTIDCEVPYQIDYCYLSTPEFPDHENFTSLKPDKFSNTKYLGICRFVINQPISGLYVCGVNNIDGGEDIQTYYRVKVYEVPVKTSTALVQGAKGQLLDLMVKTIFDYPMAYCRFMKPNGQVHGVSERFNLSGGMKFFGKGLQYGECGVQIVTITEDDFGVWKATVQVEDKEYNIEMVVTKQGEIKIIKFY